MALPARSGAPHALARDGLGSRRSRRSRARSPIRSRRRSLDGLVGAYAALGALAWVAAAAAGVGAAAHLVDGRPLDDLPALASHLVGLCVLPFLVLASAWALVPAVFGPRPRDGRVRLALPLLAGAFLLAPGIAFEHPVLVASGSTLLGLGFLVAARELVAVSRDGRRSRDGQARSGGGHARTAIRLAVLQVAVALVLGPLVFSRGDEPVLGIPHERLVLLLPALAALGWLPLCLLALAPSLAPADRRAASLAPYGIVGGAWLVVGGLAGGIPAIALAGAAAVVAVLGLTARAALARRGVRAALSGAGAYAVVAGLALAQALVVGGLALVGAVDPARGTGPYAVLLLGGWATAAALGLVTSALPDLPRAFVATCAGLQLAGVELLAFGALAGETVVALFGAALLVAAAVAWAGGLASTLLGAWREHVVERRPSGTAAAAEPCPACRGDGRFCPEGYGECPLCEGRGTIEIAE